MLRIATCAAVIAVLAVAAAAPANVIWSWENSGEGWSGGDGYSTSTGVTDGTYAILVNPLDTFWGLQSGNWNSQHAAFVDALANVGTTVSFDVTTVNEDLQGKVLSVGLWMWHDATNGAAGSYAVATDGTTQTLTFDLSGMSAITQYRITTSVGGSGLDPSPIYIDNFQVTPEPASLALMGLGAVAMIRRRRR